MGKEQGKPEVLKRLIGFVKPYWWIAAVSIAASLLSVGADMSVAYLVRRVVDSVMNGSQKELTDAAIYMVMVILVGIGSKYTVKAASGRLGIYALRDIRNAIISRLEKVKFSFIESNHTGEISSRITNNAAPVQAFLENYLCDFVYQPALLAASLIFMGIISWKMLIVNILLILIAFFVVNKLSAPLGKMMGEMQLHLGKVNEVAQDSISGINLLKSYNLQLPIFKKYSAAIKNVLKKGLEMEKRTAMIGPIQMILHLVPFALCIMYGGYLSVKGEIAPGGLLTYLFLLNYLIVPMARIPQMITSLNTLKGAAAGLFELLDWQPERSEGDTFRLNIDEKGKRECYEVELNNVSFSYDGESRVLDGISFKLQSNSVTAMVGPSGCGKTTVLKLLCGFYEPIEGQILLAGKDTQSLKLDSIRAAISLVSQDTFLFPGTIAENIGMGKKDATFSEIVNAAKTANAHDFILQLPEGYDTLCGERGARLSGGQRQMIALSRAVLKNSPILLLDEPTSALDTQNEALLQKALEEFTVGKTVLVIAHRLSTIKNANSILVLDKGRVVEAGTHDELLDMRGLYSQLYLQQYAGQGSDELAKNEEAAYA